MDYSNVREQPRKKMNIVFLHRWTGVHDGGTETEVKNLSSFLANASHNVTLLTLAGSAIRDLSSKVKIIPLKKAPFESVFSYHVGDPRLYIYTVFYMAQVFLTLLYLRFVRGIKIDIISVHFYVEAFVARMFRVLTGTPYTFVLEGYTRSEAKAAKLANVSFCISEYDRKKCETDFDFSPILKHPAINTLRFEVRDNNKVEEIRSRYLKDGGFLCLTVCRLEPRKDLATLILGAELVARINPKVKFLIVGEGISEIELKALVKNKKLEGTVYFAGRAKDADLPSYFQSADLFVLSTLYEGFGIVYLEAMATGLPILTTSGGASPEVVGDAGLTINPKDPQLLSESILGLVNDRARLIEFSRNGVKRMKEKYSPDLSYKIFEENLKRALNHD